MKLILTSILIFVSGSLVGLSPLSLLLAEEFQHPVEKTQHREILHGPLKISANETLSKEKGKIIEAKGNVAVKYEMESGEVVESLSQFALYHANEEEGELWGNPKVIWKQSGQEETPTTLKAEKIFLKIKNSEIIANRNVTLSQANNLLNAQQVKFFGLEKKLVAEGERPSFMVRDPNRTIKISSEKIIAWAEKKQILFNDKVQGTIEFSSPHPQP